LIAFLLCDERKRTQHVREFIDAQLIDASDRRLQTRGGDGVVAPGQETGHRGDLSQGAR